MAGAAEPDHEMRYLFFTNTPAHIHLYRNAVAELRDRGHEVLVLARDYGCTLALADYYDLPYRVYGRLDTTKLSLVRQLPRHYVTVVREARRFDPDRIFGMGGYAAHAGLVSGASVVLVTDSEGTHLDHAVSRPFADAFLTPYSFEKDLGDKQRVFRGFKESAYLHPEVYEPSPDVREELGVGPDDDYVIVRLNAFGSHHDVGEEGFTPEQRRRLLDDLADHATVFVSDEGDELDFSTVSARPYDLHPARIHDALAEASLLVADTQTMVTEAALVGTPAVRSNSFVGDDDMGNFHALERAGLVYNLEAFGAVLDTAVDLLDRDGVAAEWDRKRASFVADTVNLTDLLVRVATDPATLEALPTGQSGRGVPGEPSV